MLNIDLNCFKGEHCETTAAGTLLNFIGEKLSEPMLFGLGQGLGFIYWDMKKMNFPFLGGRIKPDAVTQNLCRNLNLELEVRETASLKTAWKNVTEYIDSGIPVGLKLDCYHLEYFTKKFHFAAHYAALYGYDDMYAYLIDTAQQGSKVQTSLKSLELARNEKGHMSSKNLSYVIKRKNGERYDLKQSILKAVKNNAYDYLNPPISNIGYKGIEKTACLIKKWFQRSRDIESDLTVVALLMEKAGTGGALFRNLYRDFLKEASSITGEKNLEKAYIMFKDIAPLWNQVSGLISKAGLEKNQSCLEQASENLLKISALEKKAMELI